MFSLWCWLLDLELWPDLAAILIDPFALYIFSLAITKPSVIRQSQYPSFLQTLCHGVTVVTRQAVHNARVTCQVQRNRFTNNTSLIKHHPKRIFKTLSFSKYIASLQRNITVFKSLIQKYLTVLQHLALILNLKWSLWLDLFYIDCVDLMLFKL